jgi:hypothetical protein
VAGSLGIFGGIHTAIFKIKETVLDLGVSQT